MAKFLLKFIISQTLLKICTIYARLLSFAMIILATESYGMQSHFYDRLNHCIHANGGLFKHLTWYILIFSRYLLSLLCILKVHLFNITTSSHFHSARTFLLHENVNHTWTVHGDSNFDASNVEFLWCVEIWITL